MLTDEEAVLIAGAAKFGVGNWSEILKHYDFGDRKSVDLKDKWKSMRAKNKDDLEKRLAEEEQKLKSKRPNK